MFLSLSHAYLPLENITVCCIVVWLSKALVHCQMYCVCMCLCVQKVKEIMAAVTIPVMAKVRIGHFVEAQILEALGVDFIDESEGW